jgi:hypothetical protein
MAEDKFELPPFIPVFTGLDEHLYQGKFTPTSLGIYLLLLRHCHWGTGVYFGCAGRLENLFGGTANKAVINHALAHLRGNRLINYPKGDGTRGSYNILVHKHLARVGALKGFKLNAFGYRSLEYPLYYNPNGGGTVDAWSPNGGRTVIARKPHASGTHPARVSIVQEVIQEGPEGQDDNRASMQHVRSVRLLTTELKPVVETGTAPVYCSYCSFQYPAKAIVEAHELFCPENVEAVHEQQPDDEDVNPDKW